MDRWTSKLLKILKEIRQRKRLRNATMGLAGVVVFVTTYNLILPAITIGNDDNLEDVGLFLEDTIWVEEDAGDYYSDGGYGGTYDYSDQNTYGNVGYDNWGGSDDVLILVDEEDWGDDNWGGQNDQFSYVDPNGGYAPVYSDDDLIVLDDVQDEELRQTVTSLSASTTDFSVLARFNEMASVPVGTQFVCSWAENYRDAANMELENADWQASSLMLYDMSLVENGNMIWPAGQINLEVTFTQSVFADRIEVLSFGYDQPQRLVVYPEYNADGSICRISFTADSMSVFAIAAMTARETEAPIAAPDDVQQGYEEIIYSEPEQGNNNEEIIFSENEEVVFNNNEEVVFNNNEEVVFNENEEVTFGETELSAPGSESNLIIFDEPDRDPNEETNSDEVFTENPIVIEEETEQLTDAADGGLRETLILPEKETETATEVPILLGSSEEEFEETEIFSEKETEKAENLEELTEEETGGTLETPTDLFVLNAEDEPGELRDLHANETEEETEAPGELTEEETEEETEEPEELIEEVTEEKTEEIEVLTEKAAEEETEAPTEEKTEAPTEEETEAETEALEELTEEETEETTGSLGNLFEIDPDDEAEDLESLQEDGTEEETEEPEALSEEETEETEEIEETEEETEMFEDETEEETEELEDMFEDETEEETEELEDMFEDETEEETEELEDMFEDETEEETEELEDMFEDETEEETEVETEREPVREDLGTVSILGGTQIMLSEILAEGPDVQEDTDDISGGSEEGAAAAMSAASGGEGQDPADEDGDREPSGENPAGQERSIDNISVDGDAVSVASQDGDYLLETKTDSTGTARVTVKFDNQDEIAFNVNITGVPLLELDGAVIRSADGIYLPEYVSGYAGIVKNEIRPDKENNPYEGSTAYLTFSLGLDLKETDKAVYENGFIVSFTPGETLKGQQFRLLSLDQTEAQAVEADFEEKKADGWEEVESVSFRTSDFGNYAVAYVNECTISAKGEDYEIVVRFDPASGVPADAVLAVTEIEGRDYETYRELANDTLETETDKEITYARFFEIKILSADGEVIKPSTPVNVEIHLPEEETQEEEMNLQAIHLTEEGPTVIDANIDESISFEAGKL